MVWAHLDLALLSQFQTLGPNPHCSLHAEVSQLLQFSASLPVPVTSTGTSALLTQPNPAAPQLPQTPVLPTHQNPLLPSSCLSDHLIMDPMKDSASGPSAWWPLWIEFSGIPNQASHLTVSFIWPFYFNIPLTSGDKHPFCKAPGLGNLHRWAKLSHFSSHLPPKKNNSASATSSDLSVRQVFCFPEGTL